MALGVVAGLRPLLHYLSTWTLAYFGSAILSLLLIMIGFNLMSLGLIADMLKSQRVIQDETLYQLKKMNNDEH